MSKGHCIIQQLCLTSSCVITFYKSLQKWQVLVTYPEHSACTQDVVHLLDIEFEKIDHIVTTG